MLVVVLASFVLGVLAGMSSTVIVAFHMARKSLKEKKVATDKFLEEFNKLTGNSTKRAESVDERLSRVKEIVNEQLDLQSRTEGPQKNAMDGKYKNSMIKTIKSLEEEKHQVLKSIIDDGFDPTVTVLGPDGVVTEMKLSEFMAQAGIDMPPVKPKDKAPAAATTNKSGATKSGKFIVYRGGKDDGEGTSH
jgi:hypothetical protein